MLGTPGAIAKDGAEAVYAVGSADGRGIAFEGRRRWATGAPVIWRRNSWRAWASRRTRMPNCRTPRCSATACRGRSRPSPGERVATAQPFADAQPLVRTGSVRVRTGVCYRGRAVINPGPGAGTDGASRGREGSRQQVRSASGRGVRRSSSRSLRRRWWVAGESVAQFSARPAGARRRHPGDGPAGWPGWAQDRRVADHGGRAFPAELSAPSSSSASSPVYRHPQRPAAVIGTPAAPGPVAGRWWRHLAESSRHTGSRCRPACSARTWPCTSSTTGR